MSITYLFAELPVADFGAAYAWYERLFGRAADMFPHAAEAVWRLTSGAAVYVVSDPARAGNGRVTLAVADLGLLENRLRVEGFQLVEETEGGAPRRLVIHDGDGNRITFFEDPASPSV